MSSLNVELYGSLLGTLSNKANGFDFHVNTDIFTKYSFSSKIISLAVLLNPKLTAAQNKRASNFFNELLPEGRNSAWLGRSLPQGKRSGYDMLRKYGKDIAGALIIYDPEDPSSSKNAKSEKVDNEQIRLLFENMPWEALANSPVSGKTSLGGVQVKIVLAKKGEFWYRAHYGFPSTHILKPAMAEYPTMIYDEAFCMQMAHKAGLTEYPVWIESFDGTDALVIERYDRDKTIPGERIHQEDFNQALGAHGNEKYQEYGGKVKAKRIADTLARFGNESDVKKFASQLIFAVAIGNLDMHAKNVSVLHLPDESITLAPTYDQVPLRHQNTDGRMALSIGGEYVHANITLTHIASELASWDCNCFTDNTEAKAFINNCLASFNDALNNIVPDEKAYPSLRGDISSFIENLISGKSIGHNISKK